jgi:hypothetical protein
MTKRSFLVQLISLGGALVAIPAGSEPAYAAAAKSHHRLLKRHRRHVRHKRHHRRKKKK